MTGTNLKNDTSKALFETARRLIPGGVNSPVRAFRAVGGDPHFIVSGSGPRIVDGLEAMAWAIHPDGYPEPPVGRIMRLRP